MADEQSQFFSSQITKEKHSANAKKRQAEESAICDYPIKMVYVFPHFQKKRGFRFNQLCQDKSIVMGNTTSITEGFNYSSILEETEDISKGLVCN